MLTPEQAAALARLPMDCVCREYPHILVHILTGPEQARSPQALHPAFYGCFDWHSAVHGHWTLARLLRRFEAALPEAAAMRARLARNLTADNLAAEAAYLADPERGSFERMYGWAWLLTLAAELHTWDDPEAAGWRAALRPLEEVIVGRLFAFLPRQTYPIRAGTHPNTAFALALVHEYAETVENAALAALVRERSLSYFLADTDYPAHVEPSGADFLSPSLIEAELLRRLLSVHEFTPWFHAFLPGIAAGKPECLLSPALVSDRSDPQIGHLDGLNLSRAWCLQGIAAALPEADPACAVLRSAAAAHEAAALPFVASGHYGGEHWLATFAVLLKTSD